MLNLSPLADVTRVLFALLWWGIWGPTVMTNKFIAALTQRVRSVDDDTLAGAEMQLHAHLMALPLEEQRRLTYEVVQATFGDAGGMPSASALNELYADDAQVWEVLTRAVLVACSGNPSMAHGARCALADPVTSEWTAKRALCELLQYRKAPSWPTTSVEAVKLRNVLGIVGPGETPLPPGSPTMNKTVADTAAAEASAAAETSAGGA